MHAKPLIIGFDGSRAFGKEKTGTENYSYQLLKHLVKIDTVNNYLVYIRPGSLVDKKEWPSNVRFSLINYPRFWTQIGLAIRSFLDPIDCLFTPAHTLPLICRPGLKTVMTIHDLGAEYLPKTHQLKQRLYLGAITKFQLKKATKLIAVSKATKKDLVEKIGVDENRVEVVYEGVKTGVLKDLTNDFVVNTLKQFDLEKKNYFLYIGTIQPRKNLVRLITAFSLQLSAVSRGKPEDRRKISDDRRLTADDSIKLILIGKKGWLADDIYELPKRLNVAKNVLFLGYVPEKETTALLTEARGLVYPSLFEGFGLPILEAYAAECPVLTSNISSMPEIAGDGAVLVDPYSVESIKEGLVKLCNNKVTDSLVKKGKERVNLFSWEKCAKETLEVLEKVLGIKY